MQILVVEDEPKVAAFIVDALTEAGHNVNVDYAGTTAVETIQSRAFDLIVLDHLLPGMTGREVCEHVRGQGVTTPILMVTARDAVSDRVAGLDAGADDYLTKPFSIDELLARARALLRRNSLAAANHLTIQDLTLDPAKREAIRGGKAIPLSAREYSLLEFLMQHAGRTVTRAMIADRVWEFDFDMGSNVVEVYVSYLRAKIDHGHDVKLIKTVRGVGYQLG